MVRATPASRLIEVKMTDNPLQWFTWSQEPGVTLVGDAAHAMFPSIGEPITDPTTTGQCLDAGGSSWYGRAPFLRIQVIKADARHWLMREEFRRPRRPMPAPDARDRPVVSWARRIPQVPFQPCLGRSGEVMDARHRHVEYHIAMWDTGTDYRLPSRSIGATLLAGGALTRLRPSLR